tara:strand:- start:248 stop:628 length:381 start_codon:yes stop_codon:yes gene_type:complete
MPQQFGWAHVFEGAITSSMGPTEGVLFKVGDEAISGSANFTFASGSNSVLLTGSMQTSGSMAVTGSLYTQGFSGTQVVGNRSTINYDTDIGSNYNSLLLGPITIASGASLKIGSSSNVKIKNIEDV